jgi:hypothetical protein
VGNPIAHPKSIWLQNYRVLREFMVAVIRSLSPCLFATVHTISADSFDQFMH